MRALFLSIILCYSLLTFGKEPSDTSSQDFQSFKQKFKRDSVLSFHSPKGYFPSLIHNIGQQATFPLRMGGRQFVVLGSTTIISAALIKYDEQIDKQFRPVKEKNLLINNVSPEFTELGDYYGYMLLAGFGTYSIAFNNYKGFRTSLLASQAAITAGLWIRVGKVLTGRMRPGNTYDDPEFKSDHWFGPFSQFSKKYNLHRGAGAFDAFPSGHTGSIFAMATVIAKQYKEYKAVPVIMYSIAGFVGVSRMVEHHHWASDVFLGGVIGYFCGKQVVDNENKLFPNNKSADKKFRSYIFPASQDGINGLGWAMIF